MFVRRALAISTLVVVASVCVAQQSQIRLTAFPAMSVADGHSTTTITAEVRDAHGNLLPDGTRVAFETTLGMFRESVVTTANGVARAVLQAGGVPGVAIISVKTVDSVSQPSTLEFEFKGDRSMLSSATEYIEVVSPTYMEFSPETRIMAASAANGGVFIRYRDVTITADDAQVNIPRYEVRARKAHLKIGKEDLYFDELYLKINEKNGIGLGNFKAMLPCPVEMDGFIPTLRTDETARFKDIGQVVERFGLQDINRGQVTPAPTVDRAGLLTFQPLGVTTTSITSKKAVIFPSRVIQFQRAEVLVAGSKVMQMPLYELNLMQTQGSNIMSSMINVNNNQLQVNYPYYLSLKPGQTSLLRFRTGQSYGRGVGSSSGMFLDYELGWNRGDEMDGKFTFSGIGRRDWSIGVQQYAKLDDRTNAFGDLEVPAGQSVYGSLNVNRTYTGFQVSANTSLSQYLTGIRYNTRDTSLIAEKDPTKVGKLPFNLYYGLTAQESANSLVGSSQSAFGVRARLQSTAINLDSRSTLYAGMSVAQLTGRNVVSGLTLTGQLSLSHRVSSALSLRGTYDFLRDGYNDRFLGQHRVGLEARYFTNRFQFNMLASKSLDVDRMSVYGDLSFGITNNWWLSSTYTLDRYLGFSFLDYSLGIGYRVQGREIGLVWSRSTKRIGLQLLGAQF